MTNVENLPQEVRDTGLFCVWRREERDGKPTKVPYNPKTGGGARSSDPATFAPLPVALEARERGNYTGLGVGIFGGLSAVDLDHCIDENGVIADWALDIMRTMSSYTEYSPSGHGARILFKASGFSYDKGKYYINNQKLGLEVYVSGCTQKYVTVTGNVISDCAYAERGPELQTVLDRYMVRPVRPTPPSFPSGPVSIEDTELIEKARNSRHGAAFSALWAGDTTGYASRSEADIALCNALAWWTNRDPERVDRLFRQSGLMREKWDDRHGADSYGHMTVMDAVQTGQGGYDPAAYRRLEAVRDFSTAAEAPPTQTEAFAPFEPFAPPDTSRLPSFPVDCLPSPLRDMAIATAENLQVAVDMPAVAFLAVVSLCVQGKFIMNPKPGWIEPINLYAVEVALPSDRKSPTMKVATRYVYEYEKQENQRRRPLVDEYRMKKNILSKRINSMTEQAAKPNSKVNVEDIVELQNELAEMEENEIRPLRLLADDATPEALTSLMAANGGKMAVVSSEGGVFDIIAGRYSDKLNMDIFLKAYVGDPVQIDRKGRDREFIPHPLLTMLLTVQPSVLEGIMGNDDMNGRGFLARFLYSLPVSTVGSRRYETAPIPRQVEGSFQLLLDMLLSIPEPEKTRLIQVTQEAHTEAKRFFESLEPRLRDDLEDTQGWAGKYHGQVMRLAALLHICQYGDKAAEVLVDLETMKRAETMGSYFLAHAKAAFHIMGLSDDQDTKDAKYILKRLLSSGQQEVSKRDLFRLCDGHYKKVDELTPGLNVLTERGYIRTEDIKTGGRPTSIIYLNPAC